MDIFLIILAGICLLVGLVGSFVPVIPGVPLSYLGIILLHITEKFQFSWTFLIVWGAIVLVVQLLDSFLPPYLTKLTGGSKKAVWGSMIGCLVGFFFTPVGMILGTFLGAVVGEYIEKRDFVKSLKAGIGTFVGFMLTIGVKAIVSSVLIFYYCKTLFT